MRSNGARRVAGSPRSTLVTTPAKPVARWITVGEQRHVLLQRRRDPEGKPYVLTACGWMIWPSRHDARMLDPRVCLACDYLYGGNDAA